MVQDDDIDTMIDIILQHGYVVMDEGCPDCDKKERPKNLDERAVLALEDIARTLRALQDPDERAYLSDIADVLQAVNYKGAILTQERR